MISSYENNVFMVFYYYTFSKNSLSEDIHTKFALVIALMHYCYCTITDIVLFTVMTPTVSY